MIDDIKMRVRSRDPVTSVAAAEQSLYFSSTHKGRIKAAMHALGAATAHEISEHCGLSVVQVDRRLPEIQRDGHAEVLQLNGSDAVRDGFRVWRLVEKNLGNGDTKS